MRVESGKIKEGAKAVADKITDTAANAGKKTKEIVIKSKDSVVQAIDQNGNGEIDIEDIIIIGLRTPGVKIDRANFLQKELFKNHPQDVIDKAIEETPAKAGISKEETDKIANEVIKYSTFPANISK